ncbi:hypothetical protein Pan153_62640 [Gimesia panareensis]|uniref:Uncharacterized protein n=2 Tax=Gimesia panareensis TaxID=2527978 RepID=A0A518FZ89_9PLAN|nr:hypothetical protein Pan153_62640 [Gimesia panareensis]
MRGVSEADLLRVRESRHMDDAQLLEAFEACTLPFEEWTHRSHLRVAYLYASRFPYAEALNRMRASIKAYNKATDTPEELERGYHETITVAFVRLVTQAIRERGPFASSQEFYEACGSALKKGVLLDYYSKGRLITLEAKQGFVEPDLQPLPDPNH